MLTLLTRSLRARRVRLFGGVAVAALSILVALTVQRSALAVSSAGRPAGPPTCIHSAQDLSQAFEWVAETMGPAVVSITSTNKLTAPGQLQLQSPFFQAPLIPFMGEDPFHPFGRRLPDRDILQQGQGSGLIVSDDGYILTNNHVVRDADEVMVTLWDESTHVAEVIGTDPKTDLAVLRIEAEDLVSAELGDSEDLKVGQWVAAVGNPFGLHSTMTAGVVSAVGRSRVGLAEYEDFIQTDAAINPGNSGGPLVDLQGRVVGINTAIFSRSGGSMGIGFSIPINMARSVMNDLIADGHVERGFLGVMIQDLDDGLASSFGYEGTRGALISDVNEGSPADRAGLRAGDIIVRIEDREIDDMDALRFEVARTAPGTTVEVEVVRNGSRELFDTKIGRLDDTATKLGSVRRSSEDLGLDVRSLTPDHAMRLGLGASHGVLVSNLDPLGLAARAGLRVEDVIVAVGDTDIHDVGDFERAMREADLASGVRMTVLTKSAKRFLFIRVSK